MGQYGRPAMSVLVSTNKHFREVIIVMNDGMIDDEQNQKRNTQNAN